MQEQKKYYLIRLSCDFGKENYNKVTAMPLTDNELKIVTNLMLSFNFNSFFVGNEDKDRKDDCSEYKDITILINLHGFSTGKEAQDYFWNKYRDKGMVYVHWFFQ